MSKVLLAVEVPKHRYWSFVEYAKEVGFHWESGTDLEYCVVDSSIMIYLFSDKKMTWSSVRIHDMYPITNEKFDYYGEFHRDIYTRFKELLLQSTIVKPKLTKEDLQYARIWIGNNPEVNMKVQDVLYDLGFKWRISEKYSFLKSNYLTTDKENIYHGNDKRFYDDGKQKEVLVSDILDIESMGEYKVSKEFILEAHKAACGTWKSKLEKQFPNVFPKTYRPGSRWKDINEVECMLVRTDDRMFTIVCCANGNRYKSPIEVENNEFVTETELRRMTIYFDDFKLIIKK
jgi:hypothetical protein